MSDRVIHGYYSIDPAIVWETVKHGISRLKRLIESIVRELGS